MNGIELTQYWADEVESWFGNRVHGKENYEIIPIAGDVVVELGAGWDESDLQAAKYDMIDHNIPIKRVSDGRIRVDGLAKQT